MEHTRLNTNLHIVLSVIANEFIKGEGSNEAIMNCNKTVASMNNAVSTSTVGPICSQTLLLFSCKKSVKYRNDISVRPFKKLDFYL